MTVCSYMPVYMNGRAITSHNETGQNYVFLHTVYRKKSPSNSTDFSMAVNKYVPK